MKLHAINHDLKTTLWCGLAAMATITGKPTSECRDMVSAIRRKQPWTEPGTRIAIKGIHTTELRLALEKSGFNTTTVFHRPFMVSPVGNLPTLARYLRERQKPEMSELLLITCGNHFVVVKGRKLIDNYTKEPVWIRQAPHRRKRVSLVVSIRRSQGQNPQPRT
jgi:hypothetical protein